MVSKTKTAYVCNDCGADYRKWQGQCSECNAWNTLSEVRLGSPARAGKVLRPGFAGVVDSAVKTLADIALDEIPRISSGAGELDLVLGGGFVPGSCVLLVKVRCCCKHCVSWLRAIAHSMLLVKNPPSRLRCAPTVLDYPRKNLK